MWRNDLVTVDDDIMNTIHNRDYNKNSDKKIINVESLKESQFSLYEIIK